MKGAPWFKFFPADFMAGVAMLSSEERGSYISLLCVQWSTGWLPNDKKKLERLAGGPVSDDVMAKFKTGHDGLLRNSRLEEQRDGLLSVSLARSNAANKMWENKRNANAMQMHSNCNANADADTRGQRLEARSHIPKAKDQITEKHTSSAPENTGEGLFSNDFRLIWSAYPKKVGKIAAWRAWKKTSKIRPPIEKVLFALEAWKKSEQWTKDGGQFIPNPATWLNQGRWDDVVQVVEKPIYNPDAPF